MPSKQTIKSPLSNLLTKINDICIVCSESTEAQHLLTNALQKTLVFLRAQRGSIFIFDQQSKELVLKAAIGLKIDEKRITAKQLGRGIVGRVAEFKEPLLIEDIARVDGYKSRKSYQSSSFMSSPLVIKNKVIGVINVTDKISKKPFNQREFKLLNFLSNQIALNYQRILMTHELESQERLASLGKLAGGIAHEFNNPLDGVIRYNNLCMGHARDNEVLREYLLEVQNGLKRMANIVKNLLACGHQASPSVHEVDVHLTIESVIKELGPYLAAKNIKVGRRYAQNMPKARDLGLERIVINLLKNSIDAVGADGSIEISTGLTEGLLVLEVSDNGCGIALENMDKIFEPFFTTKDIDQGCGLGLTVIKEIVKYYQGTIQVNSRLDQGTTFTVKLPMAV